MIRAKNFHPHATDIVGRAAILLHRLTNLLACSCFVEGLMLLFVIHEPILQLQEHTCTLTAASFYPR